MFYVDLLHTMPKIGVCI